MKLIEKEEYEKFAQKISQKSLSFFIDKQVKVKFVDNKKTNIEWMWVDITDFNEEKDWLIGELRNELKYIKNIKLGDKVYIKRNQIGLISDLKL